jgi:hypothetical protein
MPETGSKESGEVIAQLLMTMATLGMATVLFGLGIAAMRRKTYNIDD